MDLNFTVLLLIYLTLQYLESVSFKLANMENSDEQLQKCENCQRQFTLDKIQLHEAYCCRNFKKCVKCGSMVDRNYMEDHDKQFHAMKKCQYCSQQYPAIQKQTHENSCVLHPEFCAFCQNSYPKNLIARHIEACGSRTKQCQICSKLTPLKDYNYHVQRCNQRKQRRQNRQRRQSSQNPRSQQDIILNQHIQQRQLYRQNSTDQINNLHNNLNRIQNMDSQQNNRAVNQRQRVRNQQLHNPLRDNIAKQRDTSKQRPKRDHGRINKKRTIIQPQSIKPVIDPVPISIRIAQKTNQSKHYSK